MRFCKKSYQYSNSNIDYLMTTKIKMIRIITVTNNKDENDDNKYMVKMSNYLEAVTCKYIYIYIYIYIDR